MNWPFVWRMAWRDSRSSRRRLLFFSLSISLGVAALVAIGAFRQSLAQAIDDQARTLIGADLVVSSARPFDAAAEKLLSSLGERQAREVRLNTMALFARGGGTRFVNLRALDGEFPFYGRMETTPPEAAERYRGGALAIADESLLFQFHAQVGDRVKIGDAEFTIAGALKKIPGDASAGASFAPRVYIPLRYLAATQLIKPGSVARYRDYVKFPPGTAVEAHVEKLRPQILQLGLDYDTVAKRKKDLGESLDNLYRFLNLVGFVALLLGAVGVASAIQAHLQQKVRTGAILRCLGASGARTVAIYLWQAALMGIVGSLTGAGLGILLQLLLPHFLQRILPMAIPGGVKWEPTALGFAIGLGICLLFALPPLMRFRRVSPLLVLRAGDAEIGSRRRDPAIWLTYGLIALSVIGLAIWQSEVWWRGVMVSATLGLVIAILAGVAKLLIVAVRRFFPSGASFVWRQGLANLYRPRNRTLLLTLSLGLGTFLLLTLFLTRDVLLAQFRGLDRNDRPNIFLFDIQPDQEEAVAELVRSLGYPVLQRAPIVTMRLTEIKGRKVSELRADAQRKIPEWELEREYRSTYREHLEETEKVTAGQWVGHVDYKPDDTVPISLDREIAKDFGATIGDELVFDVQGVPIRTRIASLREVDWKRFQTNFFVVFPTGVLENAPRFDVLVSRVPTPADSARLQSAVVAKFPGVSAIDLTSVIQTVDSVLTKVALVIRIMSLFTVGAGVIVLASTIWSGRYQRAKESILLRTLGATRRQVRQILGAEYFFLGLLASLTGILLALGASWALARFVFELDYRASFAPLLIGGALVTGLTVLIGLAASRGVGNAPPLEVLRAELE